MAQTSQKSKLCWPLGTVLLLIALPMANAQENATPKANSLSWPDAPPRSRDVLIEPPWPQVPINDRFQEEVTKGPFHGRLIYAPMMGLPGSPSAGSYFVLRGVGRTGQVDGKPTAVAVYPSSADERIYFPQFAPNGQSVLFNVGNPSFRYGEYKLYIWDFQAKQLRSVVGFSLSYPIVRWSPDSKYLACIKGGDANGDEVDRNGPPQLYIYNVKTRQDRMITPLPEAKDFVWSQQSTLLYAKSPDRKSTIKMQDKDAKAVEQPRPSIYEVPAAGGKAQQIIENGYGPSPSPDGKWVAFFGWPETASKDQSAKEASVTNGTRRRRPPQVALYLFNRAEKKRVMIGPQKSGFLRWTPDSKGLVVTDTAFKENAQGQQQGEAHITLVDVATLKAKEVTTLKAQDFQPGTRSLTNPQFQPTEVSKDNHFLFVKVSENTGEDEGYYTEITSLQAIDLRDGKISKVAQVHNKWGSVIGWDWRDES